jgi:hypothetical protein
MVVHTCDPAMQVICRITVWGQPWSKLGDYLKNKSKKGSIAKVNHEALSSNPSITKKSEKKKV